MDSVWLQDHTWEEVADYLRRRRTILVPIGAVEQHGPAGPLGVDTWVALALAEDTARRLGMLVAPPIWMGDSFHHRRFPGTIWLRSSTLIALVTDVATSLAEHGFRRQVWVNGHKGSNLPALTLALRELHEHRFPEVLFAIVDPLVLGREVARAVKTEPEHHGGALELSEILYRFPGKIREERLGAPAADLAAVAGPYIAVDLFGPPAPVEIPWNSLEERTFAPTGSIGPSASASVELGRAFHEGMVSELVRFLEWFEAYEGVLGQMRGGETL